MLGAAAGFLVVEDGADACCLVVGGFDDGGDCGMCHAQVIESSRHHEFLIESGEGGGLGVVEE